MGVDNVNVFRFTGKMNGNGWVIVDIVDNKAYAMNDVALRSPAYFRHQKIVANSINTSLATFAGFSQLGNFVTIRDDAAVLTVAADEGKVLINVHRSKPRTVVILESSVECAEIEQYAMYALETAAIKTDEIILIHILNKDLVVDLTPVVVEDVDMSLDSNEDITSDEYIARYNDSLFSKDQHHVEELDLFCVLEQSEFYAHRVEMVAESILISINPVTGDMESDADYSNVFNGDGYQYYVFNCTDTITVITCGDLDKIVHASINEQLHALPVKGSSVVFIHVDDIDFEKFSVVGIAQNELVINTVSVLEWEDLKANDGEGFIYKNLEFTRCYTESGYIIKAKTPEDLDKYDVTTLLHGKFRLVSAKIAGKTVWAVNPIKFSKPPMYILPIAGITTEDMREAVDILSYTLGLGDGERFVMLSVDIPAQLFETIKSNIPTQETKMMANGSITSWYSDNDKFGFNTLPDGGSLKVDHLFQVNCPVNETKSKTPYHGLAVVLDDVVGNRYGFFGTVQYTGLDNSIAGDLVFAASISEGQVVLYITTQRSDTEMYNNITVEEIIDYLRSNNVFSSEGADEPTDFIIGFSLDPNWNIFHNYHKLVFGHTYKSPESWVGLFNKAKPLVNNKPAANTIALEHGVVDVVEQDIEDFDLDEFNEETVEDVIDEELPEKVDLFEGVFSDTETVEDDIESDKVEVVQESCGLIVEGNFYLFNHTDAQVSAPLPVYGMDSDIPDGSVCCGYIIDFTEHESDLEVLARARTTQRAVYQVIYKSQEPVIKRIL